MIYVSCNSNCVSTSDSFSAPQIRSTILALYKLVCMYVCMYVAPRKSFDILALYKSDY